MPEPHNQQLDHSPFSISSLGPATQESEVSKHFDAVTNTKVRNSPQDQINHIIVNDRERGKDICQYRGAVAVAISEYRIGIVPGRSQRGVFTMMPTYVRQEKRA
ncbi:hypothetical protein Hypma_007310 [Hypsizygus marmoreus]|uniref:Uncharacterized protein n=1 Tax=Hypsizygus marmoreus TaxID=39966 RepID=A0A369KF91_HYPMA|nr:hypothetical protein Hypma_007310 [Hypsizygus marmoreus]